MKSICVMQPYVFPYLPYFQLASAVDEFWILDDVQFIRRGWMNRNVILLQGKQKLITFPVAGGPRSEMINQKRLGSDFQNEFTKIRKTASHAYTKAPYVDEVASLLCSLEQSTPNRFLDLAVSSMELCFEYLGIETPLYFTSSLSTTRSFKGRDRILSVCREVNASRYVNPIGGADMYDENVFSSEGIELRFLSGNQNPYQQAGVDIFVSGLSILDLIANISVTECRRKLSDYRLIG